MTTLKEVRVPDIGNAKDVTVIEVMVASGDTIEENQSLITLESDKASMEIPAPYSGQVEQMKLKVGDKVSEGDLILTLQTTVAEKKETKKEEPKITAPPKTETKTETKAEAVSSSDHIFASPIVRRLVREFDLDIKQIRATGPKGRIQKSDVQAYVKQRMQGGGGMGLNIEPAPEIDFSKFGEIEKQPLGKIKRLTGLFLHRNWVTIPHVTQFDEVDITDLEAFRLEEQAKENRKLTLLVFVMKAVVSALKKFPTFNSSLDPSGEQLILKKYYHVGIAVDTPNGLVVPVIRNVDQKCILTLADELQQISQKAREKGLTPTEMSGSCFSISSLGGIAGTAFTPIVNAPDVAILGISRSTIKPVYQDGSFVPRLMLPLSLSYDHRVIDGAEGARFIRYLGECLQDIRRLLL